MPGTRNRTPFLIGVGLAFASAVAGIVACSTSSSTAVPPTTGILIRAETLYGERGCGTGPTQLYKYAVVVYGVDPQVIGDDAGSEAKPASYNTPFANNGNVFDCYADGTFVALPVTERGGLFNSTFRLEVFAYTEAAYRAASGSIDRLAELRNTSPSWTTQCMATQLTDVESLANCNPLRAGLSGLGDVPATRLTLDTETFNIDGQVATCVSVQGGASDAGIDGSVQDDGGTDAGVMDAGEDADAAPPPSSGLSFAQVRILPRIEGRVVGPVQVVACPARYDVEVTPDRAEYDLVVELLDGAGQALVPTAQTVCKVTSQVGQTSSAVCP